MVGWARSQVWSGSTDLVWSWTRDLVRSRAKGQVRFGARGSGNFDDLMKWYSGPSVHLSVSFLVSLRIQVFVTRYALVSASTWIWMVSIHTFTYSQCQILERNANTVSWRTTCPLAVLGLKRQTTDPDVKTGWCYVGVWDQPVEVSVTRLTFPTGNLGTKEVLLCLLAEINQPLIDPHI